MRRLHCNYTTKGFCCSPTHTFIKGCTVRQNCKINSHLPLFSQYDTANTLCGKLLNFHCIMGSFSDDIHNIQYLCMYDTVFFAAFIGAFLIDVAIFISDSARLLSGRAEFKLRLRKLWWPGGTGDGHRLYLAPIILSELIWSPLVLRNNLLFNITKESRWPPPDTLLHRSVGGFGGKTPGDLSRSFPTRAALEERPS